MSLKNEKLVFVEAIDIWDRLVCNISNLLEATQYFYWGHTVFLFQCFYWATWPEKYSCKKFKDSCSSTILSPLILFLRLVWWIATNIKHHKQMGTKITRGIFIFMDSLWVWKCIQGFHKQQGKLLCHHPFTVKKENFPNTQGFTQNSSIF